MVGKTKSKQVYGILFEYCSSQKYSHVYNILLQSFCNNSVRHQNQNINIYRRCTFLYLYYTDIVRNMLYNYGVLLSLKLLIKINRNRNTILKIKRHHNKPFLMYIAFNPFHPNSQWIFPIYMILYTHNLRETEFYILEQFFVNSVNITVD